MKSRSVTARLTLSRRLSARMAPGFLNSCCTYPRRNSVNACRPGSTSRRAGGSSTLRIWTTASFGTSSWQPTNWRSTNVRPTGRRGTSSRPTTNGRATPPSPPSSARRWRTWIRNIRSPAGIQKLRHQVNTEKHMMRPVAVLTAALALFAVPAAAADTTKIVVPYAGGGTADVMARLLAPHLQERLGDHIIVENRGGASGALGNDMVARGPADGKMLLVANMASHVLGPALHPPKAYDQEKAFEPLAMIGSVPLLLAIRPDIPPKNLKELIAYGKTAPNLGYGSAGGGPSMKISRRKRPRRGRPHE